MQPERERSCKNPWAVCAETQGEGKECGPNSGVEMGRRRRQRGRKGKMALDIGKVPQKEECTFVTFFPPWHYPDIMKAFVQEVWVDASFTNHRQK